MGERDSLVCAEQELMGRDWSRSAFRPVVLPCSDSADPEQKRVRGREFHLKAIVLALGTKTVSAASPVPAHGGLRGPFSNFSLVGKTALILNTRPQCHLRFLAQQTFSNYQPRAKHRAQPRPAPPQPHHPIWKSAEEHTGGGQAELCGLRRAPSTAWSGVGREWFQGELVLKLGFEG